MQRALSESCFCAGFELYSYQWLFCTTEEIGGDLVSTGSVSIHLPFEVDRRASQKIDQNLTANEELALAA